jgi:5-methylcytosine-specific restriction enzyme A
MPSKAPQLCSRCSTLNCQQHSVKAIGHEYDLWRKRKENNPFVAYYKTARWQALRLRLLAATPVCVDCKQALATDVDHKIDAKHWVAQGHDFYAEENLQCLCRQCHSRKTSAECGWAGRHG